MASSAAVRTNTLILASVVPVTFGIGVFSSDFSGAAFAWSAANVALLLVVGFVLAVVEVILQGAVARLLGDRLFTVSIGLGPTLFHRTGKRRSFRVRALPLYCSTSIITPRRERQRLRLGAAHLAGTAVAVAAVVVVLDRHSWPTLRGELSTGLAFESVLFIIAAVVAYFGMFSGVGVLTGWPGFSNVDEASLATRRNLWWSMGAAWHLDRRAYDQAAAMAQQGLSAAPDDPLLLYVQVAAASATRSDDAFELARALVARELPDGLRQGALNEWAWECYMRGDPAFAGDADRASAEALALEPENAGVQDTRGHVLLWLGRTKEAQPLLERAYAKAAENSSRACSALGMAMLCASTDRFDEAVTWLARAREHDPNHALLPRASAMIEPLRR